MKSPLSKFAVHCCWASMLAAGAVLGADTNAPVKIEPPMKPEEFFEGGTKTYDNWVEFSGGGFIFNGNKPQFQQQQRTQNHAFGGIEDFHYTKQLDKKTTFTADGHAMLDQNDYRLKLEVTREKVGYLRLSYNQFRTWYDSDGGFYPASDAWYRSGSKGALAIDRGEFSLEGGLTLPNKPQVTFKYTHAFRDGDKSSTIWGIAHPGGLTRGLSPSFYHIDESSDAFQVDVTHHILKSNVGLGLRYEFGNLDNSLNIDQAPGEPIERKITDKQNTGYDMFNANAFTETWFKEKLMLSTGFSFSDMDNDFSGSRIYGSDFDVSYVPDALNGAGYYNLNGGSHLYDYVADINLLAMPSKTFTIVPSIRIEREDTDASFTGLQTLGANAPVPFSGNSQSGLTDVRERLDARYTGVTNWVLYARGEWTEGQGSLRQFGGTGPVGGIGVPPVDNKTDDDRLFQKYSLGARWYPLRIVTVDAGGYYKIDRFNYNNFVDSTPNDSTSGNRYPGFLVMQDFATYDGNLTLTVRPLRNVTLVSRYEYQLSTIHTRPDPVSGLSERESSDMTSHIFAQNVSWCPWSRLYLQAGFDYVASEAKTPVSDFTRAVLNAQNNYWTLNFNSGFVLNDKTDLNLGYFYYRADDYHDNSPIGVPYGAGAQEHGVTATLTRRISKNVRLVMRYGFFHSDDDLAGGHQNFDAMGFLSTLQYRF